MLWGRLPSNFVFGNVVLISQLVLKVCIMLCEGHLPLKYVSCPVEGAPQVCALWLTPKEYILHYSTSHAPKLSISHCEFSLVIQVYILHFSGFASYVNRQEQVEPHEPAHQQQFSSASPTSSCSDVQTGCL